MQHQKILSLLNETSASKLIPRKWFIVNDNSSVENEINYNIKVF